MEQSMNEWMLARYEKYPSNIVSDFNGKEDKKGRWTFEWKQSKVGDWICNYDTVFNWYVKSVEVITESKFTSELKKIGLYKTEKRGKKIIVGIRKPPQEVNIRDSDDDDDEYDG